MMERDIERYLCKRVIEQGGEVRKVHWIGRRYAPDRLVLLPGAAPVFVELKRPGETPSAGQRREHERLRLCGVHVRIVDTLETVEELFT